MRNGTDTAAASHYDRGMPWYVWFAIVLIIAGGAAVTGLKPKGTRHVARTQLMGSARWFLLAVGLIVAYVIYRYYNPA